MNSLSIIVVVLATVTAVGFMGVTTLQQTVFAIGDPNIVPGEARGHGEDVSRQAIGDPGIVPGAAVGHGEDVSNIARGPR
jgi:hypothetical protein